MNSKITELRNIYADKIIDSITTDDNWQAQGIVDLLKEYESKFKLLNLHVVSNNEVAVCECCGYKLKEPYAIQNNQKICLDCAGLAN